MIKITGKTFDWKNDLKRAGFSWNAESKTWDREEAIDPNGSFFEHVAILRGIECGDLRYASEYTGRGSLPTRYTDANAHTHSVLYGANHE